MVALTRENSDDFQCRTYDTVNRSCTGTWQCLDHPESVTWLSVHVMQTNDPLHGIYMQLLMYEWHSWKEEIHPDSRFFQLHWTVQSEAQRGYSWGFIVIPMRGVTGGLQ